MNLRSIRKNFALIVFLAVLPTVAILFYSGMEQRRNTIERTKKDVLLLTHSMAQAQKDIALSTREILSTLAFMTEVQTLDIQVINAIFKTLIKRSPNYENIVLVDLDGNVLASAIPSKGVNLVDRKQIRDALKTKDFATGEYILTRIGNRASAFPFSYPVIDATGTIKAVLAVAVKLTVFSDLYQGESLPLNSFFAITDYQGIRLLYYPPKESTNPIGKPIKNSSWEIARGAQEPGIMTVAGSDGTNRILAFEPIRLKANADPYMYVWAGVPEAFILAPANIILKRNLFLILLTTIGALFISWGLGRKSLVEPIHNLVEMTEEFAKGNLKKRIKHTERIDEFEKLTESFYSMAESLSKNQEKLQNSEDRFKKLSGVTFEGIVIHNKGIVNDVNDSLMELFGYKSGEIIGSNAIELFFPSESHSLIYENMSRHIANPYEIMARKKDGTLFPVEIESRETIKGDEHFRVSAVRDITERKRAEEEHRNLLTQLQQGQKMEAIGTLAGGIAHDFNNLLTAILGNLNLASFDKTMPDKTRTLLASAEKASLRAKDLTQQLLTFSKGGTPVKETADLKSLLIESADFVLHGKNVACQYEIAEDLWLVDVDKGQISQVIQNLVLNASDAMVNGGVIRISCQNDFAVPPKDFLNETGGRLIRMDIQDFGDGIPDEITTKIFDPFFSTKQQGNGLGLAISHSIITKHQGHISVQSSLGVGTTFTIYLPKSEESIQHKQSVQVLKQTISRSRILVMDDEELVRDLAKAMLNELAQDVLLAKDGEEAIQLYKDSFNSGLPIDLAIIDLTIQGGMGGQETVAAILAIAPDAKVVVSSGYSNNPIMSNFKEYGFVEAIAKPYQLQEIARIVYKFLG